MFAGHGTAGLTVVCGVHAEFDVVADEGDMDEEIFGPPWYSPESVGVHILSI